MVNQKTRRMVMAALLAALTTAATMVIRIPTPTLGYIHLGDSMVLICGILLGPGLGAAAAGIGSMLADLFSGFTAWAPGTFAIKALTALVGGSLYRLCLKREHISPPLRVILCGIPAEAVMVAGYFLYEVGMMALAGSEMKRLYAVGSENGGDGDAFVREEREAMDVVLQALDGERMS